MAKIDVEWSKATGYNEASKIRTFETRDIVKRLGAIAPFRVFINNRPIANPIAIFNPSFIIRDGYLAEVYARIIVGYYLYVSAIIRMEVPVSDILEGSVNINYYSSEIVVYPSTKYDIWGCEDPRVYFINYSLYMTYAGRSVNYIHQPTAIESVLPITAIGSAGGRRWSKLYVHVLNKGVRQRLIHDKDAFILKLGGEYYFFHRPRLIGDTYYLVISKINLPTTCETKPCEVTPIETYDIIPPASFELKIGWACPVLVEGSRVVLLVHGVDREIQAYRVFAVEVELGREVVVKAITPFYIMEPKTPYELYGDRPLTIFPSGSQVVDGKLIVSYGAADYMIGFGVIELSDLFTALDKGRLY